ncbi:MAG: extracellular solute-binding protein [Acholeplasmataceae bacterium]|nr:extracellular solute-binding protein [Acholeplasmataceae bacterium]
MKKATMMFMLLAILMFFSGARNDIGFTDTRLLSTSSESTYQEIINTWKSEGYRDDIPFAGVVSPSDFSLGDNGLEPDPVDQGQVVASWTTTDDIMVPIEIETKGLYAVELSYYVLTDTIRPVALSIKINDEIQHQPSSKLVLDGVWEAEKDILKDRFNNDIVPSSYRVDLWQTSLLTDNVGYLDGPLLFRFEEGLNEITLTKVYGDLLLKDLRVVTMPVDTSYEETLDPAGPFADDIIIETEGEDILFKSDPAIRAGSNNDPSVKPFGLMESRLNMLDGQTMDQGRQSVSYEITVPETAYYNLTLKVLQKTNANTTVFRTLLIDGEVPFKEAKGLAFPYDRKWQNITLAFEGEPLWFYLEEGTHTVTFEVDISVVGSVHEEIGLVMEEINDLALDIQKITGNNLDENRDWDISEYLPTLKEDLDGLYETISALYDTWTSIQGSTKGSTVTTALQLARDRMDELREEPDQLPKNMNVLSIGSGSVLAHLGNALPKVIESPLSIDVFYVHGTDSDIPRASRSFFVRIWVAIQRFVLSFFNDQYDDALAEGTLEIWVNRSRQYVDLMQQMTDRDYTPGTGQAVRISMMPNEDKLILANAAGAQPDIAMGIAAWRPYDFAIRDALYDLSSFDDFSEIAGRYEPGSFIQLVYQDGVYAIPDTQNFQLLFYRRDILETLGLEVPDTWDEVISILPELQRFGMNFYVPLASTNGFKSFDQTLPFINQYKGRLYTDDALSAAYDDPKTLEAIRFMTNIFTIYSMPLEVGSFYNSFRYGTLPIGIGDFGMYVQLLNAAPEIAGLWDIALLPGVMDDMGVVDRSFVGAATVNVIFKESDMPLEAWDFLSWWGSEDVQTDYAERLITTYGSAYLWNTANPAAFSNMSWDDAHKDVILEQWSWVSDTPKIPGSYMVERELSNIWNKVVYDGINVRTAVEDGIIVANKEIIRKMLEFGYIDGQGAILKPYLLPERETIERWLADDN